MGQFGFVDQIVDFKKGESLEASFTLKGHEEFLQDHSEGFPVMPGVLMLEALRQAASHLLALSGDGQEPYYRLLRAEDIRFGQFVKPGSRLKLLVRVAVESGAGEKQIDGRIELLSPVGGKTERALKARMTLVAVQADDQGKQEMRQQLQALLQSMRQER